ncbi:FIG00553860: hypothetical protein [Cronobacter universalis NCTC 9529]|nr:FIG00553860: hypothetical protein [Cronobacter universalis NCTC 9529]
MCCFPRFLQKNNNHFIPLYLPHLPSVSGFAPINTGAASKASVMI